MRSLENHPGGLFPTLVPPSAGGNTKFHTREISPDILTNLLKIIKQEGIDLALLLRSIWAIVLRQYIESDWLCFKAGSMSSASSALDELGYRIGISSHETPEGIWRQQQNITGISTVGLNWEMNTGVFVFKLCSLDQAPDCDKHWRTRAMLQHAVDACLVLEEVDADTRHLYLLAKGTLLSPQQAQYVADTIAQVTSEVLDKPNQTLRDINYFNPQHSQMLQEWNHRNIWPAEGDTFSSILDTIRKHSKQSPDAQAIIAWDGCLSYRDLETRSTHLAEYLCHLGVGPGVMVPMLLDHSQWVVITQLAILKAGAAFVPLEPSHPQERLRYIVRCVKAFVIVASEAHCARGQQLVDRVIPISRGIWSKVHTLIPPATCITPAADTPAYILFTSGSTGQPKGCVIDHRAMAQLPHDDVAASLGPNSRVLQFATYSYVMAIYEIYWCLSNGGTLCIPSDHDRLNNLFAVMEEMQITWAVLTPSVLRRLNTNTPPSNLQTLGLGGEALDAGDIKGWVRKVQMWFGYASSEGTALNCLTELHGQSYAIEFAPTSRVRHWIVDPDSHHKLAAVGTVGELVVESPGLAREYLDNPTATADAFFEGPDWRKSFRYPQDGGKPIRMYKTGDLFRYTMGGSMQYVGRKATQVKIRGQRLDLGEVESHVRQLCPAPTRVIAEIDVPKGGVGTPMLAVFICSDCYISEEPEATPSDETSLFAIPSDRFRADIAQLTRGLQSSLPAHMHPSVYIPLQRFPVTLTGKADRRRLRDLIQQHTRDELRCYQSITNNSTPPSTHIEREIHGLFAEVLGISAGGFGVHQSFIRLGGDSLAAMKLVSLSRKLGIGLTVEQIMENKTVAKLSSIASVAKFTPVNKMSPPGHVPVDAKLPLDLWEGIEAEHIESISACSPIQQGILLGHIRKPAHYHNRIVWEVLDAPAGRDIDRMCRAWAHVCRRHPMLRTFFAESPAGSSSLALQITLKKDHVEPQDVEVLYEEPGLRPDTHPSLTSGQPLQWIPRFKIYQATGDRLYCAIDVHHAQVDMISLGIIIRDLRRCYLDGTEYVAQGDLPESNSVSYADYAQYIFACQSEESLSHWKSRLFNAEPCVFPRLQQGPFEDARSNLCSVELPLAPVSDRLRSFCKNMDVTVATVFKLAWSVVLSAYTGSRCVCYGSVTALRDVPLPGVEDLVGPLINTLPFCLKLNPDKGVMEALRWIQELFLEELPHRQVSIAEIQHSLDSSSGPLFNTTMSFVDRLDIAAGSLDSLQLVSWYGPTEYDLQVEVTSWPSVSCCIRYWSHMMSKVQASALADTLSMTVSQILRAASSGEAIGNLDPCTTRDMQKILEWNGSPPEAVPARVHDLIKARCDEQPDALAAWAWDGALSYRDLDCLSSKLAKRLMVHGVGPEVFVGICFDRCKWTLVSVLAVAKAGGAFCLMDSSHPTYRLREICDALKATLVITTPTHVEKASECERPLLVVEEGVCSELDDLPGDSKFENPDTLCQNACYAVFTSGSTGKPKGVVITHGNLAATIKDCPQRLDLRPSDRSLHFASYAFDVSIIEIMVPMVVGACVCIPSEHDRLNNLPKVMADLGVTWAIMTPTVSRLLDPPRLPILRTLVLGGEAIMSYDFTTWQGSATLISAYSPAECTPIGLSTIVPAEDPNCLGKPFSSISPWIVDPENVQRLVPVGAVGELVIEGTAVGRGYLHDTEHRDDLSSPFIPLTRWISQFRTIDVSNPPRLYRTGDLVQYTEDGSVRFIGRKDLQVKIRGQRLELGEVESRLRSYLSWAGAIVVEAVVWNPPIGRAVLVGFISISSPDVTDNAETVCEIAGSFDDDNNSVYQHDIDKACSHLQDELPNWMVPSVFLRVQGIPMTKSGKVDRRRLRQLATLIPRETLGTSDADESHRQALLTEKEKQLQLTFANVLRMPPGKIFSDSHFFQLGGDSVGAMELVATARLQNMAITVSDVFQHPRVGELAAVATAANDEMASEIPPFSLLPWGYESEITSSAVEQCALSMNDLEDMYPCTAFQEGLMALASREAGKYARQCLFELGRDVEINKLKSAWQATVAANAILRTRIIHVHPHGTFQVVLMPAAAPIVWQRYETIDEWRKKGSEMNMGLGTTLSHFSVLSSAQGQTFIGVSLHHAIYDGVSLTRLFDQVQRAYKNERLAPAKFTPFIHSLVSQNSQEVEEFWRTEFHGLETSVFPELPEPGFVPNPTASVEKEIPFSRAPHLSKFTLSTVMRLAWALLVSYYTDTEDVVVGITVSGRARPVPGINFITGPTMATVPFRTRICRDDLLLDALRNVQDHSRRTIPFEQAGLQRIRELSHETRAACDFRSQLVIQHDEHSQASLDVMILRDQLADYAAFLNYALVIVCTPSTANQTIGVTIQFDPQVVPPAAADRLLSQFSHIVNQMCAPTNSNPRLSDIGTITPQDWCSLRQWNGNLPLAYPHTLHHLVLSQAETTPDRRAVESWDGTLTYAELDYFSGRLGQHLLTCGLKQGSRVILLFDRSLISVVAMLAVLRSGGVCVNIDPFLPQARLAQLIRQARPSMAMASSEYRLWEADTMPIPLLDVESLDTIPRVAKDIAWPIVHSTDLAFLLFTSGSTGNPKGIMVEHGNCATDINHYSAFLAITPEIRTLHFSSYAFDVSIYEVLTPWMHGGCLCIPSESARLSDLPGVMRKYQVNFSILTPSVVNALHPSDIPSMQTLAIGGEVMPAAMFDRWASHVRLFSMYGSAEATQCAAVHLAPTDQFVPGLFGAMVGASGWVTVPGNPSQLAPIGAVGELLIEGPVVTRGYFDEPEQTHASYIKPPDWLQEFRGPAEPGRLFRSGDLVQYVPNQPGWLRYIGRKDKQVKIRGQRVDLAEVEHHVNEILPAGSQAIAEALFHHSSPGRSVQLAVFLTMGSQSTVEVDIICTLNEPVKRLIAELQQQLCKRLPSYMVPTMFFPVSHVPQTSTGKADRNRLRQLVEGWTTEQLLPYHPLSTDSTHAPVETAEERTWQRLWCEVLCVHAEIIARTSHFFHLGGDSVRAMKLAGLARREGWIIAVPDIFAHPTLSEMASLAVPSKGVSAPSPDPFSLVGSGRRTSDLIDTATRQCSITQGDIEDIYPCTPLQEALIASTVQKPGTYQALEAFDLTADVDLTLLNMAWHKTAAIHAILRTRIMQEHTGELFQVVVKGPLSWTVEQADEISDDELMHFQRTMGIGTPLIHLVLLQSARSTLPDRLLLSVHHALYDGWSLPLLLEEVNKQYHDPNWPHDPTPGFNVFVSHVAKSVDECHAFWKQELEAKTEAPAFPRLPDGAYVPNPQAILQDRVSVSPAQDGSEITLATMIQASWALTASCYLNANEIGFGITTSGRAAPVPGIDRLLGPTLATLPRRIHIQKKLDVKTFLQQLQRSFTEQSKYEYIGLQQIRQLGPSSASACRFQTLLVIQPEPMEGKLDWAESRQSVAKLTHFSSVALTLIFQLPSNSSPTSIGLIAVYDPEVLAPAQMQHVLLQVKHIFGELQKAPVGSPIASLSMLNPGDAAELQRWNTLTLPTRKHQDQIFVHDMIRRRCQLQPDAVAVQAWDGRLTYGELYSYTEYLAVKLQSYNVHKNRFVALYFEKSCWTVVAQLAVLMAGGALVMLEPSHPINRHRETCQILDVTLLLGPPHLTESLQQALQVEIIPISEAHLTAVDEKHLSTDNPVQSDDLMYAIATSGTTGRPKLALVHHGGFVASARALIDQFKLRESSRVLQFSSYGFDAHLLEQLLPLVVGGCVCVPSPYDRDNRLVSTLATMKIDWLIAPASVISLLSPDNSPSIQTLVSAGEPLQQEIIDMWATRVNLINAYGPAECSVVCSVNPSVRLGTDPNNIGYPVGGNFWIVDPDDINSVLPIGAEGELLVEGPVVGVGYAKDTRRTEDAFPSTPPHWLRSSRGVSVHTRIYRTGDIARYNYDGSLHYVGRKDSQIKLNGQRIELAEVEHHVRLCFPSAAQVVVDMVKYDDADTSSLVALIVSTGSGFPAPESNILLPTTTDFLNDVQLAEALLQDRIPPYMIPTLFVPVARIPFNTNGKVDRVRLRTLVASLSIQDRTAYRSTATTEPTTDLEVTLHEIWSRVLRISPQKLGIHESFFRVGGNSISSMQLAAQCNEAGLPVSVQDIFRHRTISRLAASFEGHSVPVNISSDINSQDDFLGPIQRLLPEDEHSRALGDLHLADYTDSQLDEISQALPPGYEGEIQDIYPCSHVQQGMLISNARNSSLYQQVYRFEVVQGRGAPKVDCQQLVRAWHAVVKRHGALRSVFLCIPGRGFHQIVLANARDNIIIAADGNRSSTNNHKIPGTQDLHRPLPTLIIHQEPDEQFWIELHISHALLDGVSLRVIEQDLLKAYYDNLPSSLPDYRDYITYLRARGKQEISLGYWRKYLEGVQPCLFPCLCDSTATMIDVSEPKATVDFVSLDLGPPKALDQLCETHCLSLTAILHVVWAIVLQQYTRTDNVCFGYVTSARQVPVPHVDEIVGPMINMLPSQIQLSRDSSVLSTLQGYTVQFMSCMEHAYVSLGQILHSAMPSTQSLFNTVITIVEPGDRRDDANNPCLSLVGIDGQGETEYALALTVSKTSGRMDLHLSYQTSMVNASRAHDLCLMFRKVLCEVLKWPTANIGSIDVLDMGQVQRMHLRQPFPPASANQMVYESISQRCADQPLSPAVCAWDGEFTYEQLDKLSSGFAQEILAYGVRPEDPILVCLEKSRWVPVAMLAVWKAGACLVLLDATHPATRLQIIARQTGASMAISNKSTRFKASSLCSIVLQIDVDGPWARQIDPSLAETVYVGENSAAYIVFTSGSTGTPKGAVIEHASLAIAWKTLPLRFQLGPTSRVLQFASHAWDAAVLDVMAALMSGGCLCIPSESERMGNLASATNRMKVNWMFLTPTVARLLNPSELLYLETLVLGGEAVTTRDIDDWHDKVCLLSAYGPAECTQIMSVTRPLALTCDARNIGIPNASVGWVVRPNDPEQLVPDGAVGELLIEGPIVGRGYLYDPRPIPDAFIEAPEWLQALRSPGTTRVYRTGDLVRFAADGSLIFVGRKDDQVKLHGQRLELGEVEHQVQQAFPGCIMAIDLIQPEKERQIGPFLAACIFIPGHAHESPPQGLIWDPPSDTFRSKVQEAKMILYEKLPSYMVPSVFLPLSYLPKAVTGKVDRKLLRKGICDMSQKELDAYSSPDANRAAWVLTLMETRLQDHISNILPRKPWQIPPDQDLFQLGMDSVLAMTLIARLYKDGLKLTIKDIFEQPQLTRLALVVRETSQSDQSVKKVRSRSPFLRYAKEIAHKWKMDSASIEHILPTTYFQRESLEARHKVYFIFHFHGKINCQRLQHAVQVALNKYAILRTVFIPWDGSTIQVTLGLATVPVEIKTTDGDPADVAGSGCREDSSIPIAPGQLHTQLRLTVGPTRDSMALRLSHAQYDGLSIPRLFEDIARAYQGMILSPTTVDFPEYLYSRIYDIPSQAYQFWRDLLRGSSMTYLVPGPSSGSPPSHKRGSLTTSTTEIFHPPAPAGITMATVVRTAWALCLAHMTGTDDVVFGQLVNGRNLELPEAEAVVGACVNYVPVRVTLPAACTVSNLLRAVHEQQTQSMAFETIEYDDLVAKCTSWPADTEPGTGIHYVNIPDVFAGSGLPGVQSDHETYVFRLPHYHPRVVCSPLSKGTLELKLYVSDHLWDQSQADQTLHLFGQVVVRLLENPTGLALDVLKH
ncbi:acetyl-CoA synthetase-like protein [Aspergillus costaricaensis CBS 115574]|uniref:Acetyl-CoA synthetase-like protein n=1 Tax=Aspergillus costaricaensis CBS 115574 TaxID=1448317 RepID=A0ACD1I6Y1_9EURO|nr:acetyl-CoA synthetase-like protein [Aspergillus costaricaensis CBS 115574]RAK85527.1 acetyl-CoA synthetase-like protein [Aspergillus costaricaensis CBS 115574]